MTDDQPGAAFPLEKPGPLSRSLLWQLQRRYFEQAGIGAWSEGEVPMWVTTNAFIARAYAQVAEAFLSDWLPDVDPGQPVYAIELGAGSGAFAYHFLRQGAAQARLGQALPPVTYVLTEYNPALLDYWAAHPRLQPYLENGQLDLALFDAEQPGALTLRRAGVTLQPGNVRNPMLLFANYFFDSVPQDAFYLAGGELHESLAALTSSEPEPDPANPALLGRARLVYERHPASLPYYGDRDLDGLLEEYRYLLEESALAFPIVGLRDLAYFDRVSGGRLLLLSTDKGYHRSEDLQGRREPGFEVHGSFSMGVNYHAFGQYCRRQGGMALHLPHRHSYLDPCAFLLGHPGRGYSATLSAYAATLAEFGPEDFYLLQGTLEREHQPLRVEQTLAWLRLSGCDAHVFRSCFGDILATLADAPSVALAELAAAGSRLWENYYDIGEAYDLAYDLGVLYYKLNSYETALVYFLSSLATRGPSAKTWYNMALCHYLLGDRSQALACLAEAEKIDPGFEQAPALRRKISLSQ